MSTRIDYGQIAAKLDYPTLEKKLEQMNHREPPKKRKTAATVLEPLRERLLALHRNGWSSGQLAEELKAAGVPVSPARLRECLSRWTAGGDGAAKCAHSPPTKTRCGEHAADGYGEPRRTEQRQSHRVGADEALNGAAWNHHHSLAGGMLADPARWTPLSRPARCVCGAVSAYRWNVAVRGCALLATDSQERPSVVDRPFRGRSVVVDTPCPHSFLSLTQIIPITVCEGYSPCPLGILCTSNTVK